MMVRLRIHLLLVCLTSVGLLQVTLSGQQRYFKDSVPDGSGGFRFHFYDVYNTPMDWDSAHDLAQMLLDPIHGHTPAGIVSHLVSIDSQQENDFVQSIISGDSWIGLTDRVGVTQKMPPSGTVVVPAVEGTWFWTQTHPVNGPWPPNFAMIGAGPLSPLPGGPKGQNWATGQPGTNSPDAAYMLKSSGKWMSGPSGYAANFPAADPSNANENFNFKLPFVVEYELYEFDINEYLNNGGM